MTPPDYDNGLPNLMAAVAAALGANRRDTGYSPLAALPPERLRGRPVILLVVDGLGARLLDRHRDGSLARYRASTLNSVFPTTTASAITTFATGVPAQQHAVTGWFVWLREMGSVAAILPFAPRGGGLGYARLGVEPGQLVGGAPLADSLDTPCRVVTPATIVDSAYSRFTAGRSERYGHRGLDTFFDTLADVVRHGPGYTFAYWTEVDSLAHEFGAGSPEVHAHVDAFDAAFGEFLERVTGMGALVLVTADHGLVDTVPERVIRIEEHPPLARSLALPLCGEPRTAFCYVRPRRADEFEAYVRDELGEVVRLYRSETLIEGGWFGRGEPDPRLWDRVGDYTLLMRDNWVIRDRLLTETPFRQIGVHGGLSAAELQVPLIIAEP